MNWQEWRQNDDAKRKTMIFAVAAAVVILFLIFPWNYLRNLGSRGASIFQTSTATGKATYSPRASVKLPHSVPRPPAAAPEITGHDLPPSVRSSQTGKYTLDGVDLLGVWQAQGVIPKREGACTLNLEVRENPEKDGELRAYTTLACPPFLPLWANAHPHEQMNRAVVMLKGMSTTESILSGSVDGESVVFSHVKETLGVDSQGCALESLNLRIFGDQRLAVKWSEGACEGGELILRKVKN